jgi:hypothetical protein
LQIPKRAQVALEGCNNVVTIARMGMTQSVDNRPPIKPTLVNRNKLGELIQWMSGVTNTTPHLATSRPTVTSMRKVGAKEAVHPLTDLATLAARTFPKPEGARIL